MAPQMLQPRRQGRGRYGERMHHGGGHERERRLFGAGTVFKRKEGDTKGTHTMLWLALDNSAVSNEEVDAKLDAWEEQSARIRKEARRLQREVAAET